MDIPTPNDDSKYITFRRADIIVALSADPSLAELEITDAVVIRRQDLFASPALATYASMIATAIALAPESPNRSELRQIGDYFQRMSELAADEGYKLPTL